MPELCRAHIPKALSLRMNFGLSFAFSKVWVWGLPTYIPSPMLAPSGAIQLRMCIHT